MIFSQRYKDLIDISNEDQRDVICGNIDFAAKQKIAVVLEKFREPQTYHPNRYNDYGERTDALEIAVNKLKESIRYPVANLAARDFSCLVSTETIVTAMLTPYLFDLIELQYDEFIKAVEFLERYSFAEAITNTGKSYESVMKIICGDNKGNANELTQMLLNYNHYTSRNYKSRRI